MIYHLQCPPHRIAALFVLVCVMPLSVCAESAEELTVAQRQAISQISKPEFQARLFARFADVVSAENERSGTQALSIAHGQQPAGFRPMIQEENKGQTTQIAYRDAQSGQLIKVSRRKFVEDEEKRELKSESFDVLFDHSGLPSGLYRRDGDEVLALYTNGIPKSYCCNIGSNLWYHVAWSEDGSILSERTAGRSKVIGRVESR